MIYAHYYLMHHGVLLNIFTYVMFIALFNVHKASYNNFKSLCGFLLYRLCYRDYISKC